MQSNAQIHQYNCNLNTIFIYLGSSGRGQFFVCFITIVNYSPHLEGKAKVFYSNYMCVILLADQLDILHSFLEMFLIHPPQYKVAFIHICCWVALLEFDGSNPIKAGPHQYQSDCAASLGAYTIRYSVRFMQKKCWHTAKYYKAGQHWCFWAKLDNAESKANIQAGRQNM